DLSGIRTAVPQFDLHERYKDFVFIILTFAPLTADSYLHGIITALRSQLMSPRIGLVIIGSGPAKQLFKEKVKLIGIERSVAFVEPGEDMTSFLKTADLLIEGGAGVDAERNVLRAAAAGLPVITAETEQIASLFQDGTNAFVCPKGDVECLGKKTNLFLNQSSYRSLFSRTAADIVATRVDEDPVRYYETYRDTIECIISST
ncbi:glycosyltransferase, partial [Candidatus Kaiserbacteria bacterium]|nr:glycosyltransferase [Candidatus Kaiserbacteria bacterium]